MMPVEGSGICCRCMLVLHLQRLYFGCGYIVVDVALCGGVNSSLQKEESLQGSHLFLRLLIFYLGSISECWSMQPSCGGSAKSSKSFSRTCDHSLPSIYTIE